MGKVVAFRLPGTAQPRPESSTEEWSGPRFVEASKRVLTASKHLERLRRSDHRWFSRANIASRRKLLATRDTATLERLMINSNRADWSAKPSYYWALIVELAERSGAGREPS